MDPVQFNNDAAAIAVALGAVCYWCEKGPPGGSSSTDSTAPSTKPTTRSKTRQGTARAAVCKCKWCGRCGKAAVYEYEYDVGGGSGRGNGTKTENLYYRCGSTHCNSKKFVTN